MKTRLEPGDRVAMQLSHGGVDHRALYVIRPSPLNHHGSLFQWECLWLNGSDVVAERVNYVTFPERDLVKLPWPTEAEVAQERIDIARRWLASEEQRQKRRLNQPRRSS